MWNKEFFSESSDLLKFLNELDKEGVSPDNIKLSGSSFGSTVYYYHFRRI